MKVKYFFCLIVAFLTYHAAADVEIAAADKSIRYTKNLPIPGIITTDTQTTPATDASSSTIEANKIEQEQTPQSVPESQLPVAPTEEQQTSTTNEEILTNLAAEDLTTLIALLSDNARIEELKNNLTLLQKAGTTEDTASQTQETEQNITQIPKSFTEQVTASMQKFYDAALKLPSSQIVRNELDTNSLTALLHMMIIFIGLTILWWVIRKCIMILQTRSSRHHEQTFSMQLFYGILTFLPIGVIWLLGMFVLPYISLFKTSAIEATQILLSPIIVVLLLDNMMSLLFSLRFHGIRLIPTNRYTNRLITKYIRRLVWLPLALFLIVYVLRRLPNQPVVEVRTTLQLCAGILFLFGVYRFIMLLKRLIERYYEVKRPSMAQSQFIWLYDWLTYSWYYLAISYLIAVGIYWFSDFAYRRLWLAENTIGIMFIIVSFFALWRFIYCFTYSLRKPLSRLNTILVKFVIIAIALFIILRNLGFDITDWLKGEQGEIILTRTITLIVLFVFWYIISTILNSMVNKYLTTTDQEGSLINENGRLRTILPLIKNIILIGISLIFILIALSSINVNIMPLLAGAGVVGIAIGFGSQKLVADFITGIFNLIEDTMQVGDVVQINALSGTVDSLSVRSVRLRDASGNVHTIPFSAVEQVSNLTREFSFAVIDIGVAYNENIDYVFEVLSEIGKDMREDQPWSFYLLEDLEIFGLDSFGDSSVNIRARFKTRPGKQFGVRREFNRRIKNTFDEKGIQIPYPHLTIYHGDKMADSSPSKEQASKETTITVIDEQYNYREDEDGDEI